ncbi:hypothetical protein O9992_14270 [Vibrio lentus]|nr:hypothetical protein [Vibrio lentus]
MHQTMQASGGESAGIEPGLAEERLQTSLSHATQEQELKVSLPCY